MIIAIPVSVAAPPVKATRLNAKSHLPLAISLVEPNAE